MKNLTISITCMIAVLMTGCANREINLRAPSVPLVKTDVMPTKKQLSGAKTKVVIFKPEDSQVELAQAAKLGHTLSTELSKYIAQTGSEIVDRNLAKQLEQELLLAETRGVSNYDGPNVADYALNGSVATAYVGSSFTEASSWVDKKGKRHVSPAKCNYKGTVSAQFKIYKMTPKLSYVDTIEVEDSVSTSQETRSSNCSMSVGQQKGLVSQAAAAAVKDARIEFQNFFAPKAYILEAKKNDERYVFKLSGGKKDGFQPETDITVYTNQVSKNPITGEESIEEMELGEGIMSDKIGPNYAWIIVEEPEVAEQIRLGDYAKLKFEKGFFEF